MQKIYIRLLMAVLLCTLCLTACDSSEDYAEAEYGDPVEYAGVYYSGAFDGRALFLYQDGRYEWYSVPVGGAPQIAGTGVFKTRDGAIIFGYLDDKGDFVIDNQLWLDTDRVIEGSIDFNKQTDEINASLLDEFTAMPVPMEAYIGQWENDSLFGWITISKTEYLITYPSSYSSGDFAKGPDYLLVGIPDDMKLLTVTGDGGLKLEGTDGTYYPKGDDRLKNAPHKAFIGNWHNKTTDDEIQFAENGIYAVVFAGMNDDGSINFGVSSGNYEVRDGMLTFTHEDIEHTAEISDGVMRISGIDGLFEKN